MCVALNELMKDELENRSKEAREEERQSILVTVTENLMKQDPSLSHEEAAEKARQLITVF